MACIYSGCLGLAILIGLCRCRVWQLYWLFRLDSLDKEWHRLSLIQQLLSNGVKSFKSFLSLSKLCLSIITLRYLVLSFYFTLSLRVRVILNQLIWTVNDLFLSVNNFEWPQVAHRLGPFTRLMNFFLDPDSIWTR